MKPVYAWTKRYGLPVLMIDPMPQLGFYIYQRAMFRDGFPRAVRWMPVNWITVPIVLAIGFAIHVRKVLAEAKERSEGGG